MLSGILCLLFEFITPRWFQTCPLYASLFPCQLHVPESPSLYGVRLELIEDDTQQDLGNLEVKGPEGHRRVWGWEVPPHFVFICPSQWPALLLNGHTGPATKCTAVETQKWKPGQANDPPSLSCPMLEPRECPSKIPANSDSHTKTRAFRQIFSSRFQILPSPISARISVWNSSFYNIDHGSASLSPDWYTSELWFFCSARFLCFLLGCPNVRFWLHLILFFFHGPDHVSAHPSVLHWTSYSGSGIFG